MTSISVLPLKDEDREWAAGLISRQWGARMIISKGKVTIHTLCRGLSWSREERVGLATYNFEGKDCELVTIQSVRDSEGIGSALLSAVRGAAELAGCRRIWLITTNDNLRALGFYQKRGMSLVAVYRNAMEAARRLKPQIPQIGQNGIPIRDEIELEITL